ncbi:hypothetical protein [Microbacterium sp. T32]|uniref:hypothetical protein n=1 Tax=Microbacterium sp. T32 TaxID=1776083 RepID=UPI0012E86AB6|nr:hypothetical protein [Microbacterium sp. T32]
MEIKMNEKLRVLICDNDQDRVEDWRSRIAHVLQDQGEVQAFSPAEFGRAVNALNQRVRLAKDDPAKSAAASSTDAARRIDTADVLILDSDLTPDPDSQPGDDPDGDVDSYLVGEVGQDVAHMARAHSRVGSIVVVNQSVKHRTFDLTMTRWRAGAADAYITHDDVDNVGLWNGFGAADYRPWGWPVLSRVHSSVGNFTKTVDLDTSVLECLDLIHDGDSSLTYRQLEALLLDVDDPAAITIRDVARSPSFGIGRLPKDDEASEQLLSIGVWGLRRWLERVVLPAQNVLIDTPHLLQDRPWHARERGNLDSWNADQRIWARRVDGLLEESVNTPASDLLGRQVWNVALMEPEASSGHRVQHDDPVFCEDTSRFESADTATSFESDLEGLFSTRYVAKLSDVDYTPRHRMFQ